MVTSNLAVTEALGNVRTVKSDSGSSLQSEIMARAEAAVSGNRLHRTHGAGHALSHPVFGRRMQPETGASAGSGSGEAICAFISF